MHVVGAEDKAVLAEGMLVQGMGDVLPVAVVVVVGAGAVGLVIGLVVLVVGVREFEMAVVVPGVTALQSGAVAVEMVVVGVALTGSEEVASPARKRQPVGGAPYQPLLHVVGLLAVEAAQVGVVFQHRLVVRQPLRLLHQFDGYLLGGVRFRQIDGVDHRMLETGL